MSSSIHIIQKKIKFYQTCTAHCSQKDTQVLSLKNLSYLIRQRFTETFVLWNSGQIMPHFPTLLHGCQTCVKIAKSMAWKPDLWHGCQICDTEAKPVSRLPNLWHGYQTYVSVTVAKSVSRLPPPELQQPYLWHGCQICGIKARPVALGSLIWKQNRKV